MEHKSRLLNVRITQKHQTVYIGRTSLIGLFYGLGPTLMKLSHQEYAQYTNLIHTTFKIQTTTFEL